MSITVYACSDCELVTTTKPGQAHHPVERGCEHLADQCRGEILELVTTGVARVEDGRRAMLLVETTPIGEKVRP